ncbi:hypothetical protein QBC39DRAFT_114020 [Podospora conica]|nr:hypothetical protein QBC39DRAFT_114020 [Schizothecium conicum]
MYDKDGFECLSHGKNLKGNEYCVRNYGPGAANDNTYFYKNADGSYYYSNPDGSTYFNNGRGFEKYTPPPANGSSQSPSSTSSSPRK